MPFPSLQGRGPGCPEIPATWGCRSKYSGWGKNSQELRLDRTHPLQSPPRPASRSGPSAAPRQPFTKHTNKPRSPPQLRPHSSPGKAPSASLKTLSGTDTTTMGLTGRDSPGLAPASPAAFPPPPIPAPRRVQFTQQPGGQCHRRARGTQTLSMGGLGTGAAPGHFLHQKARGAVCVRGPSLGKERPVGALSQVRVPF